VQNIRFQTIYLIKPNPTQLYWLLTLHITLLKLLYSWMENTVIQRIFLKFDQSQKKQIFQKKTVVTTLVALANVHLSLS